MQPASLIACLAGLFLSLSAAALPQPQQVQRRQLLLSDLQQLYLDGLAPSATPVASVDAFETRLPQAVAEETAIPIGVAHRIPSAEESGSQAQTTASAADKHANKTLMILVACVASLLVLSMASLTALIILHRRYRLQRDALDSATTSTDKHAALPVKKEDKDKDALASYKAFWESKRRSASSFVSEAAGDAERLASVQKQQTHDGEKAEQPMRAARVRSSMASAGPLPAYAVSAPVMQPAVEIDALDAARAVPVPVPGA